MDIHVVLLVMTLGLPLIFAIVLTLFRERLTRTAGALATISAGLSLLLVLLQLPALESGLEPMLSMDWVPAAGIGLGLHLDWLAFPFLLVEAAVTFVAMIYAMGYHHTDSRTPYFYALLLVFAVGMGGTTLADDLFLFYICWELMLVASALLILVWGDGEQRGPVALIYFIFTHVGSLLVLVGLLTLFNQAGSDRFAALRAGVTLPPAYVRSLITLFLIGFSVKMAVFPVHFWLPGAHTVAPMPVTIMLAAAMLSMGTYGILRFPFSLFSYDELLPFAVPMMIVGVLSEIYGALMAFAEDDIKRIIAYSSVSQMGYVLFGLGTLTYNGVSGATLHVMYHAIVKGLLFMAVGLVIYATGARRLRDLGGVGRQMPLVAVCAGVGALAIAATPPFGPFDSEWMIFSGAFSTPHTLLTVFAVFGSLLTVGYALWFMGRVFFGPSKVATEKLRRPPLTMVVPTVVLAVLALAAGIYPTPFFNWVARELPLLMGGAW